MFKSVQDLIK